MNATLRKFGYPGTLVAECEHWCVLLRPAQATLGALVLGHKGEATSFPAIPPGAFAELGPVTRAIEGGLRAFLPYDKINYLMLMMVDPHVHFHVLPRYAAPPSFAGKAYPDKGWPGVPDLGAAITPDPGDARELLDRLRRHWPKA